MSWGVQFVVKFEPHDEGNGKYTQELATRTSLDRLRVDYADFVRTSLPYVGRGLTWSGALIQVFHTRSG